MGRKVENLPVSRSFFALDCKTVRIFAYSSTREQSNKRCGTRLKTESALPACEARAVRAHKTLTPRVTDFFTDFEEKTDCFAVYLCSETKRKRLLRRLATIKPD